MEATAVYSSKMTEKSGSSKAGQYPLTKYVHLYPYTDPFENTSWCLKAHQYCPHGP